MEAAKKAGVRVIMQEGLSKLGKDLDASTVPDTVMRIGRVSHSWLWQLQHSEGDVLPDADYTTDVRRRLGARFLDAPGICYCCGAPLAPHTPPYAPGACWERWASLFCAQNLEA